MCYYSVLIIGECRMRDQIIELLKLCENKQQSLFMRMYSPDDLNSGVEACVHAMPDNQLERALEQCSRTVRANKIKVSVNSAMCHFFDKHCRSNLVECAEDGLSVDSIDCSAAETERAIDGWFKAHNF